MLNINGLVKVTKIDSESKFTKACIYFGVQNKSTEEWENSFFNCKFVGEAHIKLIEAYEDNEDLEEKDPIFITKGIVTNKSYEDKKGKNKNWLECTIFDFIYGEEMEEHLEQLKSEHEEDKPKDKKKGKKEDKKPSKKK